MPLTITATGEIATYLDTLNVPGAYPSNRVSNDGRVVGALVSKLRSEKRKKLFWLSDATLTATIRRFTGASHDETTRRDAHKVHYKNDAALDSWDDLATFVLDEVATQSNRAKELELAMIVAKSPLVMATINTTIMGVEKLMMAVRLSRGASLNKDADGKDKEAGLHEYPKAKLAADTPVKKLYLAWTQHKSINAALGDSGAGFTIRMALLHDLMEFSAHMFNSQDVNRLLGTAPLTHEETVSTADGLETRDKTTDQRSIIYCKSLHCPSECGPSYTTARLLRLPNALSSLTAKQSAPDPITRNRGVRFVPTPPGYLNLSSVQKGHIAWGIFGWWTLNFPKHWGNGAHCFFEVSDAARSCQCPIVDRPGTYPAPDALCKSLKVTWTAADKAELKRRRLLLTEGTEQTQA